jgi:predicted nucleotidyltransferase
MLYTGSDAMHPEIARHHDALERLCRQFHVRRLELFGSAATGRFRPGESDVDFLVEFEPLPPGEHATAYFGLLFGLEDLFGRSIDLVMASAIKNPYFRQSVDATKVLVFAA